MDELRISKGIARWTGSFVPPTSPYGEFTTHTEVTDGLFYIGEDGTEYAIDMQAAE